MRNTQWRPFIMFGFMLVIGLGIFFLVFSRSGNIGPGLTYGNSLPGLLGIGPLVLVFPCLGFVMMLLMFFFGGMGRRGRPHDRGGPMGCMSSSGPENTGSGPENTGSGPENTGSRPENTGIRPENTGSEIPPTPIKTDLACPYCASLVQPGWNVCPQCGASLK